MRPFDPRGRGELRALTLWPAAADPAAPDPHRVGRRTRQGL